MVDITSEAKVLKQVIADLKKDPRHGKKDWKYSFVLKRAGYTSKVLLDRHPNIKKSIDTHNKKYSVYNRLKSAIDKLAGSAEFTHVRWAYSRIYKMADVSSNPSCQPLEKYPDLKAVVDAHNSDHPDRAEKSIKKPIRAKYCRPKPNLSPYDWGIVNEVLEKHVKLDTALSKALALWGDRFGAGGKGLSKKEIKAITPEPRVAMGDPLAFRVFKDQKDVFESAVEKFGSRREAIIAVLTLLLRQDAEEAA